MTRRSLWAIGGVLAAACLWSGEAGARADIYVNGHYQGPLHDQFQFNHQFVFCRVEYSSMGRWGRSGRNWQIDYPDSDVNFSLRLSQLTSIDVGTTADGRIWHASVRLDDPDVRRFPFLYMVEVGALAFSEAERQGLRDYLLQGGFLLVDDFWGDSEWDNWEYEIGQVLPPTRYPIVDIPLDHPIFNIVFPLDEVPQVPAVNQYEYWLRTGDAYEGQPTTDPRPHCRGIFDDNGRLIVVMMHNSDLGDGWEREAQNEGYFRDFSAKKAYPMGINIVVYAMTH